MADAPNVRKIAPPAVSLETREFWEGVNEGRLLIKHCGSCDQPHHYPRGLCPHCMSADTRWEQASGQGEIYSVSVTRRGPGAPFALAYVTLDEGVSMLTNIVECDYDAIGIGQRVVFNPVASDGEQKLPAFRPA